MIHFYPYLKNSIIRTKPIFYSVQFYTNVRQFHNSYRFLKKKLLNSHRLFSKSTLLYNKREKSSSKLELIKLFKLARPEKWKLTGACCLLLISSAVTVAVPFSIGKVIDTINSQDPVAKKEKLHLICSFLVIAFIIGAIANFGRVQLIQISGQRIVKRLREDAYLAIMTQEMHFFDCNKTGELTNRLQSDAQIVGYAITQNLSDGLRSLTSSIASVTMMIYTSASLAFVGLCTVTPVAILAILYGRFLRTITRKVQDEQAAANQIAEERISSIKTVRAFAQERTECKRYKRKLGDMLQIQNKEALARAFFFGATGLSGNLIVLSVLYYGGTMLTESEISIGDLSAFLMYAGYLGLSLGGITGFYTELMRGLGASTKLWEILDKKPTIPISGGLIPSQSGPGLIEFKGVNFAYPTRSEVKIFDGLNLTVPAGSITAIVGSSGSGKSTVAGLLLRYYDPDQGNIYVDGLELSTLDPTWLRKQIGLVSQEPILFSTSIKNNILYGANRKLKTEITEQEIIEACKEANAFDFIQNFPEKLDTLVGQQGHMLSGGQRQRIAIARAIIKNPTILILDEATSALDAESEHLVQEAVDKLMKGRTVITIAHRLSTIIRANVIAVFKNGVIIEMGTYDELMNIKNGVFQKLIERQTIM